MKILLKQLKLFLEFFLVYLIFIFLSLLPINLVSNIGGLVLKFFGPFTNAHKTAISNYRRIFKNISENEINKNVLKSWENLGKTIFELSILEKIVDKKNNKIVLNGLENIKSITESNEQVIFFSIHQSNWEILLPVIDQLGISTGAIYRHINNRFINNLILKKRNRSLNNKNSFYTPKGIKSAKDIITAINKNLSILLLIDQKDSAGEIVKLFNISAKTQTGFIKIARKNKLKLIPIQNSRNKNNFTIRFCEPIEIIQKDFNDCEAMLYIHKIIEKWIVENPTQWFWQHNRFN